MNKNKTKTKKNIDGSCFISYSDKVLYKYIDITDTDVFEKIRIININPGTWVQYASDIQTKKIIRTYFEKIENWLKKPHFTKEAENFYWNFVYDFFYDCLQRDENKNLTWGICTLWQLQNFIKNFNNITLKKYLDGLHNLYESNPKVHLPKINENLRTLKHKEIIAKLDNNKLTDTEKIMIGFLQNEKDFLTFKKDFPFQTTKADLTGFTSTLEPKQIETLFEQLKGNYIDINTNYDYFKAIFINKTLPDGFKPVKWKESIPLFLCLMFGFDNKKINEKIHNYKGIVKPANNHYQTAINCFEFSNSKLKNKNLSNEYAKLTSKSFVHGLNKLLLILPQ